jgi:hypothetical protein
MKIRNNNILNYSVNNSSLNSNSTNSNIEKLEAQSITTDIIENMSPKKEDMSKLTTADLLNARNLKLLFCFIGLQVLYIT